ncbi:N-acetylneuraminate synthase family protein [Candidatus Pelagibacter sp.]|nr:N-acetylneuraminate synthase family protein [Candidatus Pelagibacter sp.]|tara:strand:- start:1068 stop:1757 length:690 start_codon:yes stop_codon:yes gene_type:complete
MIFISEIGMNYNGNFSLIYELIKQSKISGASICKFQLGWRDKPGEINQLDLEKVNQIINWCNYFEVEPMFSIISEKAYEIFKQTTLKKIKIASRSLKFDFNLVKKIVEENEDKKIYMSLGMWEEKFLPFNKKNIDYLFCVSKYPTFSEDLTNFPKKFSNDSFVGYSDHTIGIDTCLLAIARGAKIIEKHFTLDKSSTVIRDHALSATPEEFRTMVNIGLEIYKKVSLDI